MKVAIVCDVLGKSNNGTTIALTNLINSLRNKGHEVTVVCPDADKKDVPGYAVVPVRRFLPLASAILRSNGVKLAKPDKKLMTKVISECDVVHVEIPLSLGVCAAKIARKLNKPMTVAFHMQAENLTAHFGLMNFEPANRLVYKTIYSLVYEKAFAVHYPTRFIKDVFENTVRKKTNAYVISNGVNKEFFKNADEKFDRVSDKFTILCAGRLSAEKAQQQLIYALSKSKHKDDIHVLFAGDGPKKHKLTRLIKKYDVDAEFKFFTREQLIAAQHGSDLYVHTALMEIEALCCIEAIVSGLVPLICNSPKSATASFAIDENNLFTPFDSAELAAKIDFWYEHPELIKVYKERYRKTISAFDQSACMDKMEKMLYDAYSSANKNGSGNEN